MYVHKSVLVHLWTYVCYRMHVEHLSTSLLLSAHCLTFKVLRHCPLLVLSCLVLSCLVLIYFVLSSLFLLITLFLIRSCLLFIIEILSCRVVSLSDLMSPHPCNFSHLNLPLLFFPPPLFAFPHFSSLCFFSLLLSLFVIIACTLRCVMLPMKYVLL